MNKKSNPRLSAESLNADIFIAQARCERVERRKLLFILLNSVVMKPHKTESGNTARNRNQPDLSWMIFNHVYDS